MNIEKLYFELKLRCLILVPHSAVSSFVALFLLLKTPEYIPVDIIYMKKMKSDSKNVTAV